MTGKKKTILKGGSRSSRLALVQTEGVLAGLRRLLPRVDFECVPVSSPGDRDRELDLRESPPDFFTRDLDRALLDGTIDFAVHSAKDIPEQIPHGLDWFWLPWAEDKRDVLVVPKGETLKDLPGKPRIGLSSERREKYCRKRFPNASRASLRGNIEDRIRKLDQGEFDLIVTAAAALNRLGLADRISEFIPLDSLPVPDGQGVLAVTFRADDERWLRIRGLFVAPALFVGAGVGAADMCTLAGIKALQNSQVCLYDALFDHRLLEYLPADAIRIDVGKRSGRHRMRQTMINELLARHLRRGLRVTRLKGGDPGIFGRLADETGYLEGLHLPYRVIPGVSSLNAATTGTGMLLTRRNGARGFCVVSARRQGGGMADLSSRQRKRLPIVVFMGTRVIENIIAQCLADGWPPATPAAMVLNAGGEDETVLRATLGTVEKKLASCAVGSRPGLFLVGKPARYSWDNPYAPLKGNRLLVTCSETLAGRAIAAARCFGANPVRFPLLRLTAEDAVNEIPARLPDYDWLTLTSPSAVNIVIENLIKSGFDLRLLPSIAVSGPATARALSRYGIHADSVPARDFGATGLVELLRPEIGVGMRILRARSDWAGTALAEALRKTGARVDDLVVYGNTPIKHESLPQFDSVFFASASAANYFIDQWGGAVLTGKMVAAMGEPTNAFLRKHGINGVLPLEQPTVEKALLRLASEMVARQLTRKLENE